MSAARSNKGQRFPAEILTSDEIKALLKVCSTRAPTGIRNRALLVALYRGGLRISEALALKPKDLDREHGTVRVLHGKGNRSRVVGLDVTAFAVIECWLERRAELHINGRHRLFCTLEGKPLDASYVRHLLPRLASKAGIEKRVHPHALRHTHAAELAREGVPLNLIQAQLGHSNVATTSRYLAHIAPTELISTMQGREWEV
jgi:site-specific recombinase XerD